jgi:hypothetical protein
MMVIITGILKWVLIVCVSATTIAIVVSGTVVIFQEVVFFLIDKIPLGRDKNKELFKYYWVRKKFNKWVKENEAKGINVKDFKIGD